MIIIPAIDLKEGHVVRLLRGDFSKKTIYNKDPVAVAKQWASQGAQWLHIVDLDATISQGASNNRSVVGQVAQALQGEAPQVNVQMGGGVRSREVIEEMLAVGVNRVVIGTKAATDAVFRKEVLKAYGEKIAIGVDAKGTQVMVEGWTEAPSTSLESDWVDELVQDGARTLIYTDIERDGTLEGPALKSTQALMERVGPDVQVIASGGVGALEDLKKLSALNPQPWGAIVGKALYEKQFTLKEALQVV